MAANWKRIAIATALVLLAFGFAIDRNEQKNKVTETVILNCQVINQTRLNIVEYVNEQLDEAAVNLYQIDYYQNHPDELEQQLRRIQDQRDKIAAKFAPVDCSR